ncbi:phosphoserine phosphatase [Candidatus Endobugula sertula]|uniref:Phosphoserine phosphatase n=1 Tax=Candidatus Endobugula sertula TaxID=62101 RepID=A0A1D2QTE4_9GAMM|nr:phosphoserine phosphatase [Candidatus Endobugula sertula]
MNLAIFDLDNTLIGGDSDYEWIRFIIAKGMVDAEHYEKENNRFYQEYKNRTLDIFEYQRFVLEPLMALSQNTLAQLQKEFMETNIAPIRLVKAETLLQKHRSQGDTLLVITATNRFVTAPIVDALKIDNLLATDPEVIDGHFTGNIVGDPCYQEGKVRRLERWLKKQGQQAKSITFYSDSINDAPLLHYADYAIVVDPDDHLRALAEEQQWPIISLRSDIK